MSRTPASRGCRPFAAAALGLVLATAAVTSARAYEDGELYLLTNPYQTYGVAIARIDPITGADSLHANLPWQTTWRTMTYDAHRDALFVPDGTSVPGRLGRVDADGSLTYPYPSMFTPKLVAARGDGILYLFDTNDHYRYLDADDVLHDLLDESGDPLHLGSLSAWWDEMFYDEGTNALILANGDFSGYPGWCPANDEVCILKIPLNAAGTQVAGPFASVQVDVVPSSTDEDNVTGMSAGPDGSVLIAVDTNINGAYPRMQRLDPSSMTTSIWATNNHSGANSVHAGSYSREREEFILWESFNNRLITYPEGGAGAVLATIGSGFASESARLVEIRRDDAVAAVVAGPAAASPAPFAVPNPLTGGTSIRFVAASRQPVRVTIHDAAGRRLRTLADGPVAAGPRQLDWDGRDDRGARVTSGVYFARVEQGARSATFKLAVVR
ncbi:MAG TPA: FlgD immunoglobulin-like domain containing protein [bacterium]|nr:FlgD immunoglobulin-like domain containing protein [bacterium]